MNTNHARNWQQYTSLPEKDNRKKVIVKVRKKNWLTKGEKIIYAFLCTSAILFGTFIVSYSSSIDGLNRNVQSLDENIEQQQAENNTLLYEIRELSKSERITEIAKENGLKVQGTEVKRATN